MDREDDLGGWTLGSVESGGSKNGSKMNELSVRGTLGAFRGNAATPPLLSSLPDSLARVRSTGSAVWRAVRGEEASKRDLVRDDNEVGRHGGGSPRKAADAAKGAVPARLPPQPPQMAGEPARSLPRVADSTAADAASAIDRRGRR